MLPAVRRIEACSTPLPSRARLQRARARDPRPLGARGHLRAAARAEPRRPEVVVHRRPGDREQEARRAHGVGPDAQGRLPALQGAARLRPALPERLRLPGAVDRGRRRARSSASTRSARSRSSASRSSPRRCREVVVKSSEELTRGCDPARPVDGLGQRLLHLQRHEHRVHLALPEDRATSAAGSTSATARPSGARAAAPRSRSTS